MNFSEFHFAHPYWLWALWLPLLIVWLIRRYPPHYLRIRDFADPHLLPYLLVEEKASLGKKGFTAFIRKKTFSWILLWAFGILALAGPRWDYEEQEVFHPHVNLMILLDLSESMRVKDLPHARLEQAKQEIGELLENARGVHVGLMVFAGLPHLVTPVSDDYKNLLNFLDELHIEDIKEYSVQGTHLVQALKEVPRWLRGEMIIPHVLLISDGDFEEAEVQESLAFLHKEQFFLHTLGVGTPQGNFIPLDDKETQWLKDDKGNVVVSHFNEAYLRQLALAGQGIYRHADYQNDDTQAILTQVRRDVEKGSNDKTSQRLWHERFYLLVGLMMILFLPWFRDEKPSRL